MKPLLATLLAVISFATAKAQVYWPPSADTVTYSQLNAYRQTFCDYLPKPIGITSDYAHLFTDAERHTLNNVIDSFRKKTSVQVCIVTLDTICVANDKFDDLALHIANAWGVGEKGKNNGITICLSAGYRRIRICNGNGIVKIMSNNETADIIDNTIIPAINKEGYYVGMKAALNAIMKKLSSRMPH